MEPVSGIDPVWAIIGSVVLPAIGVAAKWGFDKVWAVWRQKREDLGEQAKGALADQKDLTDQVQAELTKVKAERDAALEKVEKVRADAWARNELVRRHEVECMMRLAHIEGYIETNAPAFAKAGIPPYKPWKRVDGEGSTPLVALPPTPDKE